MKKLLKCSLSLNVRSKVSIKISEKKIEKLLNFMITFPLPPFLKEVAQPSKLGLLHYPRIGSAALSSKLGLLHYPLNWVPYTIL
jgi:hypothetical protein